MTTGVPHGSVLDPLLYTAYVILVGQLIVGYGVHYHEYADETQLFTKMSVPATAVYYKIVLKHCNIGFGTMDCC